MKTKYLVILILVFPLYSFSQSLIKEIEGIEKVQINDIYGDLKIVTNSSEKIKTVITGSRTIPGQEFNFRPENYQKDNTQLGLHFEHKGKTLIISCSDEQSQFTDYRISIPKNTAVEIRNKFLSGAGNKTVYGENNIYSDYLSEINIRGLKSEIVINVFASDIKITNVTGPLVLGTFTGSYNIDFSKLSQDNPSSLELFNGDIQVSLPHDTKSDISLNAERGYIRTDFTIKKAIISTENSKVEKKRIHGIIFRKYYESKIEGKLNRGGVQLDISGYNGNIKLYGKDYPDYPFYLFLY